MTHCWNKFTDKYFIYLQTLMFIHGNIISSVNSQGRITISHGESIHKSIRRFHNSAISRGLDLVPGLYIDGSWHHLVSLLGCCPLCVGYSPLGWCPLGSGSCHAGSCTSFVVDGCWCYCVVWRPCIFCDWNRTSSWFDVLSGPLILPIALPDNVGAWLLLWLVLSHDFSWFPLLG